MNQLAMNTPDMSECDILHTLRWSSRLRIISYVVWIKVQSLPWNSQCRGFEVLLEFKASILIPKNEERNEIAVVCIES